MFVVIVKDDLENENHDCGDWKNVEISRVWFPNRKTQSCVTTHTLVYPFHRKRIKHNSMFILRRSPHDHVVWDTYSCVVSPKVDAHVKLGSMIVYKSKHRDVRLQHARMHVTWGTWRCKAKTHPCMPRTQKRLLPLKYMQGGKKNRKT